MARTPLRVVDDVLGEVLGEEELATGSVDEADLDDYLPAKGMSLFAPKKLCKMIRSNIKDTIKAYECEHHKWDLAFKEYRLAGVERDFNDDFEYEYHLGNDTDENIVRTNARTLMRSTYMQNPQIEFTGRKDDAALSKCLSETLKFIFNKKTYPGVNMKQHARRWILHGHLTNFGVLRLDFQPREGSVEATKEIVAKLEQDLKKEDITKQEIRDIVAKLEICYEDLPDLKNKGMELVNVLPMNLIIDPATTQIDLSDCRWTCEIYDEDKDYVTNKYYEKNKDGEWVSKYNPKHTKPVARTTDAPATGDRVAETVMGHRSDEVGRLVTTDTVTLFKYYDKIMRRIYLFAEDDWECPLYIWEDQMKLSRFFPHFILAFGEAVEGVIQPGEVGFYIGKVNEINKINREVVSIRDRVFNIYVYDKDKADEKEIKKLIRALKTPGEVRAFGITKVGGEGKLSEVLEALAPPSLQYKEFFDTTNYRQSIDRAAATSNVDRGEQFKANTTKNAVEYAAQTRQETVGVTIDVVEEGLEDVAWAMCELLVSKYDAEEIAEMIGQEYKQAFTPMSVQEFNQRFRMQLAAGSIEKPTSEYKKKEAMEVAQALGQIGQAAPGATLSVILRMFKERFQTVVTDEDWKMLKDEMSANLTKGQSTDAQSPQGHAGSNPQPVQQ